MKIKKGYVKAKTLDGWVVTPVGEESKRNRIMLTLNETAADIWDMLSESKSAEEITRELAEMYGISEDQARSGVERVTETLLKEGVLDP